MSAVPPILGTSKDFQSTAEGDRIVIRRAFGDPKPRLIAKPLRQGGSVQSDRGRVNHDDILGRPVNTILKASNGNSFTVHEPTLAEHIVLSPHLTTPIYPADAHAIVNLLDLHPEPPGDETGDQPKLEIFECGSGHGALTLYLSRAIHAANAMIGPPPSVTDDGDAWIRWKSKRAAVIHSLDISKSHSNAAKQTVRLFRRGMYSRNIDFHVGSLTDFFGDRESKAPFLTHAVLDMPNAQREFSAVVPFLHIGGSLLLFMPSVTQILEAQKQVLNQKMPLFLETVIEVGTDTNGGREWSVRFVRSREKIRASQKSAQEPTASNDPEEEHGRDELAGDVAEEVVQSDGGEPDRLHPQNQNAKDESADELHTVCRPKPRLQYAGGVFIGLWRRIGSRTGAGSDNGYTKGLRDPIDGLFW